MGLRPTASADTAYNSDATNEMAPALTEPAIVKNTKLRFTSSPKPVGVSFQSAFEKHLIVSDGPKVGSLMKIRPMDQESQSSPENIQRTITTPTVSSTNNYSPSIQETVLEKTPPPSSKISTANVSHHHSPVAESVKTTNSVVLPSLETEKPNEQYLQQTPTSTTNTIASASVSFNTMGLQKKRDDENVEMEQILGDLASTTEIDLLQVFKSLETAQPGDGLCDLAGSLGLFNDVDVMSICNVVEDAPSTTPIKTVPNEVRDEIEKRQLQMQRKCDFLMRRLRKLQARHMGQHVSEEVGYLYSDTFRAYKKKEREQQKVSYDTTNSLPSSTPNTHSNNNHTDKITNKPITPTAMKSFLKKIGHVSATQSAALAKYNQIAKNNNETSPSKLVTMIPNLGQTFAEKLELTSGMLQTELRLVEKAIDSDATASSSGGESADELIVYNNPTQETLSISKRAAWRWARDRASIATRWSWLLAQISDLEYRIRQHNELHHQIRKNKGAVIFEDSQPPKTSSSTSLGTDQQSVNGYRGILPGNSKSIDVDRSNCVLDTGNTGSARTRAFQRSGFKKRKLLQTVNLHTISKKAARPSTIKCDCQWPLQPCALCTGRHDPMAPRDLPDTMPASERVALLDPCFHPVLSFPEDVSHSVHFEAIMRLPEWQTKASRLSKTTLKGSLAAQKAAERVDRISNTNKKKMLIDGRRKYSKKFGFVSNKQLKKSLKSRRTAAFHGKFSTFNLLPSKNHRKISSESRAASSGSENGIISTGRRNEQHQQISSIMTTTYGGGGDQHHHDNTNSHYSLSRSKNSSPTPPFTNKSERSEIRKSRTSYDIDSIVIPYSVAAATRVELLPYKEIPTPKWRIVPDEEVDEIITKEEEVEQDDDITEESLFQKHDRALQDERKKFQTFLKFPWSTRSRANRRTDSRAESSGTNTPDPTSPAIPTQITVDQYPSIASPQQQQSLSTNTSESIETAENSNPTNNIHTGGDNGKRTNERRRTISFKLTKENQLVRDDLRRSNTPDIYRETVQPYEPLPFPLPENVYEEMFKCMPDEHKKQIDDCLHTLEENKQDVEMKYNNVPTTTNDDGCNTSKSDNPIEKLDGSTAEHNIIISRTTFLTDHFEKPSNSNESEDTESIDSLIAAEEDPDDPEWKTGIAAKKSV